MRVLMIKCKTFTLPDRMVHVTQGCTLPSLRSTVLEIDLLHTVLYSRILIYRLFLCCIEVYPTIKMSLSNTDLRVKRS